MFSKSKIKKNVVSREVVKAKAPRSEKLIEAQKRYYQKNRDYINEQNKAYYHQQRKSKVKQLEYENEQLKAQIKELQEKLDIEIKLNKEFLSIERNMRPINIED